MIIVSQLNTVPKLGIVYRLFIKSSIVNIIFVILKSHMVFTTG